MAKISKKRAEALWDDLRSALELSEEKIAEIVEARAWEPLGYESFADCWADRLSGLRLYGEIRAVVVFQMFDEGASVSEVADAVAEMGAVEGKRLKQAHTKKMSPKSAAVFSTVRQHTRKAPSGRRFVRAELSPDELAAVKSAADFYDVSVDEFVKRSVLREAAVAEAGYAG